MSVENSARPRPGTGGSGRVWSARDYIPFVSSPAQGDKLASSAVAPLVAAARPMTVVTSATLAEARARWGLPDARSRQGRRLRDELATGDALVMPHYIVSALARSRAGAAEVAASSVQYRPQHPAVSEEGRELKYEVVAGQPSVIGVHPATPPGWVNDPDVAVILAEGLLKADAIVSALVAETPGLGVEDLALGDADTDPAAARARLRGLMQAADPAHRVLVLSVVGVGNWARNPEWTELDPSGRPVWLAFDGDVASNPAVWRQASRLWDYLSGRGARCGLLSPQAALGPQAEPTKMGVDDWLADHGTLADLASFVSDRLPPAPYGGDDVPGMVRVSADGCSTEMCTRQTDSTGRTIGTRWEPHVPLGGRVVSTTVVLDQTDEEIASGRVRADVESEIGHPETVEVDVCWRGEDASVHSARVSGPITFLDAQPERWYREGAHIPRSLRLHPKWPPTGKTGAEWREAIKANTTEETLSRVAWSCMGWAPSPAGGVPAFLAGAQVIGGGEGDVVSAVTDQVLAGASDFGAGPDATTPTDFTDPAARARLAADLTEVLSVLVDERPFTDPGHAAIVLAAALRPAIPIRTNSTIFFVGPPASGKSFGAAVIAGFWAARPGVWTSNRLPGAAKDTVAATENALGRTMLWVVDDLAPSADPRKAVADQARLEDIIRGVFNGTGKRRMNADGSSRGSTTPRALLVATAENEPSVQSIRDRSVTIRMTAGTLNPDRGPTDRMEHLCQETGSPARVSAGLIHWLRYLATDPDRHGSWERLVSVMSTYRNDQIAEAVGQFADAGMPTQKMKRWAAIAGDLNLTFQVLAEMADELGLPDRLVRVFDPDGLPAHLIRVVADGWRESSASTPGRNLMRAIALLMRSKAAHVINATDPASPPASSDPLVAASLGWSAQTGEWRPAGAEIGAWCDGAEPQLILDERICAKLARSHFPELVPPGTSSRTVWAAAKSEGLVAETGRGLNTVRRQVSGERYSGRPVRLDVLLAALDVTGEPAGETPAD